MVSDPVTSSSHCQSLTDRSRRPSVAHRNPSAARILTVKIANQIVLDNGTSRWAASCIDPFERSARLWPNTSLPPGYNVYRWAALGPKAVGAYWRQRPQSLGIMSEQGPLNRAHFDWPRPPRSTRYGGKPTFSWICWTSRGSPNR